MKNTIGGAVLYLSAFGLSLVTALGLFVIDSGERMLSIYAEKVMRRVRRLRPLPQSASVTLRDGITVMLRPAADPHERDIYLDRIYEPGTLALFDDVLRPGDIMVDIGANIGLMTLHAAGRVGQAGRVIAIEPHPAYAPRLAQHLSANGITNVTLLRIAAGDSRGTVPIYDVPAANIGRSSLIKPIAKSHVGGLVPVEPLDAILQREGVAAIRLMKIDVEGFEANVLRGALETIRRFRPVICMEVSAKVHEGTDTLEAHDLLMRTGFYEAFRFRHGKNHVSDLIRVNRERLLHMDDNVIYVPHTLRSTLPVNLFC